jgi:hypothetical protein
MEALMDRSKINRVIFCSTFLLIFAAGCGIPGIDSTGTPATKIIPPALIAGPTLPAGKSLLIYDDDGSRDGTVALLYLLSHPEISIGLINISYGEAHPDVYIQHIGRMLDNLGIQGISLGAGQDAPPGRRDRFPGLVASGER